MIKIVDIAPQIHSDIDDEDEERAVFPAFSLYLLGHDTCKNHQIVYTNERHSIYRISSE